MNLSLHTPSPPATAQLPSRRSSAAAGLLSVVGIFQVALAAGAPWGAAAWGGAHPGVLPDNLRVSSAVSAVVYGTLAVVTATALAGPTARRRILTGAAGLMAVGTLMNLASPSLVEKALWSPVAASLAVLLWRTRRDLDAEDVAVPVD